MLHIGEESILQFCIYQRSHEEIFIYILYCLYYYYIILLLYYLCILYYIYIYRILFIERIEENKKQTAEFDLRKTRRK